MIYLVVILTAVTVGLLVAAGATAATSGEKRAVDRQLATLKSTGASMRQVEERRQRQERREQFKGLMEAIGDRVQAEDKRASRIRRTLEEAGLRHPDSVTYYLASRAVLAVVLGMGLALLGGALVLPVEQIVLLAATGGLLGWMLPFLYVWFRSRRRKAEIQRSLPDALDLMVVCVEAGLGLNQALLRVGEEMDRIAPTMSDELTVLSLEIRAGTPREEALRNLARRTGVSDVQSLVGMLIQTDRFGTSIARALRVQSEALRTKRRQRAEEQAAKTSIKMLFPLVFFIFRPCS